MHVLSHDAGELASSSSSSFLGTDEAQTSSSNSAMGQAMATFPLSFLMPNCSALQGLDQQVIPTLLSVPLPAPTPCPTTLDVPSPPPPLAHMWTCC